MDRKIEGPTKQGGAVMYQEEISYPTSAGRMGGMLDRVEAIYLRVLRAVILVLATFLLIYVAWLGITSLYKVSRSPESVREAVASVSADEITAADAVAPDKTVSQSSEPQVDPNHRAYYADFVKRYHKLFSTKFEPFKQKDDKIVARDAFDDNFVKSSNRLDAVTSGELDFSTDKADLDGLLAVMSEAADKPLTKERLEKYRVAKKVSVSKEVQRTRTTYRDGWDSTSTACSNWYYDPIGCSVRRAVQTPYTEVVTTMEFPKETRSHSQLFRAFQDRYLILLQQRRGDNAAKAISDRRKIIAGQEEGRRKFITMIQIFGGFLLLMFFFLLIAIERHQRKMAVLRANTLDVIDGSQVEA